MRVRSAAILSVGAAGLLAPELAQAQIQVGATEAEQAPEVGELIVTARRREERLSDVPAAATALTAETLAERGGGASTGEILAGQPGVRFNNLTSAVTSELSIRASSTARATNGDPSVGLYRNGAYVGGGGIGGRNFARVDFFDVERVEVLRGTQGALYGRNAVGGAVNLVSARPAFENTGYIDVKYGFETNRSQAQVVANVAASDELAFRFGVDAIHQDKGFFYNPDNDVYFDQEKGHALRGQVRAAKGPVDITLLAESQQLVTPAITYQLNIAPGSPGFPGGYVQDPFSYPWNTPPLAKQNVNTLQALAAWDLGWARLESTSMFRERESAYNLDSDTVNPAELARARAEGRIAAATPVDPNAAAFVLDSTKTLFEDLRLSGDLGEGALNWLAGLELLRLESRYSVTLARTPTPANPSPGNVERARLQYDSAAAYGSLDWRISQAFSLAGELRYTVDDKTFSSRLNDLSTGVPLGGPARQVDAGTNPDNLSYNATLSYRLPGELLAYLKAGTSYRAGGFNRNLGDLRQPVTIPAGYGDETATSYEAGLKGAPTRSTYVALAVYRTELEDMIAQLDNGCAATNPVCPVAATTFLTNVGDAEAWGVEAEATGAFQVAGGRLRVSLAASRQGGEVTSGPYRDVDLPQVPEWLASAEVNFRRPLGAVEAFGNLLYTAQWGGRQELNARSVSLDDYQTVNLRAGVALADLELAVYADNVFDTVYVVQRDATIRRYSRPRVLGVQARYRW